MKQKVFKVGSVLAYVVVAGAGAGTAYAQAAPADPDPAGEGTLTPGPADPACPAGATCPPTGQMTPPAPPEPYSQQPPPQQTQAYATSQQSFEQRYGLALSAGGGVADWFDQDMRNATGVSGTWEVRGYVGLNMPVGLEVAYVGRASSLDPFIGPDVNSDLVGNGVEAVGRINVFRDLPVQPYGIVGFGWTRFSATDDVTLADFGVNDSDDILQIPLGAGAAWRSGEGGGLLVDARFTFRPTLNEGLVVAEVPTVDGQPLLPSNAFIDMDSWEVSGRVGYEF